MKSIGTKKPCQTTNQKQGFMCQQLKESQHDYYTTKFFKPKQPAFNYW